MPVRKPFGPFSILDEPSIICRACQHSPLRCCNAVVAWVHCVFTAWDVTESRPFFPQPRICLHRALKERSVSPFRGREDLMEVVQLVSGLHVNHGSMTPQYLVVMFHYQLWWSTNSMRSCSLSWPRGTGSCSTRDFPCQTRWEQLEERARHAPQARSPERRRRRNMSPANRNH